MKVPLVFYYFLIINKVTFAANILYVTLTLSPSHTIWDRTLAYALTQRHNITFLSHGIPGHNMENMENFTAWTINGKYFYGFEKHIYI